LYRWAAEISDQASQYINQEICDTLMLRMLNLLLDLELVTNGFNNCPATQKDAGVVTKVFSFLETFILP
jgi:hypothetical protein